MAKKFSWLKLRTTFFNSPEIDWIHEQPNGAEIIYIYLRLCLLAINSDGVLERKIGPIVMPYTAKKLAEIVSTTAEAMTVALAMFKQIGLIEQGEQGEIIIPKLMEMVGTESESAERVRRFREKRKEQELLQSSTDVTLHPLQCNATGALQNAENVTLENKSIRDIEIRDIEREYRESQTLSNAPTKKKSAFKKPTLDELKAYIAEKGYTFSAEAFIDYYESNGWMVGRNHMKSWKAACNTWQRREATDRKTAAVDRDEKIKQALAKGGGWAAWRE